MKRKENDLNQTSMIMFQPLIFQGVYNTFRPTHIFNSEIQFGAFHQDGALDINLFTHRCLTPGRVISQVCSKWEERYIYLHL